MTLKQYAAEQGYPDIIRYTLPNGAHVFKLYDKTSDAIEGLPFFCRETANGWQPIPPAETIKIMEFLYST